MRNILNLKRPLFKRKPKKKPENFGEALWSWTKTILGALIVVMILNGLLIASFVVPTPSMESTVMAGDFLFVNKFIYGPTTPQVVPFLNIPLPFYKFPAPADPEKGDVIVFIFPGMRNEVKAREFQYYLKRCVATAGDSLQIINNKVYVNGKMQPLPPEGKVYNYPNAGDIYETFPEGRNYTRSNYGPIRIPKKGDVINLSRDNMREWDVFIQREGHKVDYSGPDILIDDKAVNKYVVERDYCFGMGDNRDNSLDSRFWGFIPYENVIGSPLIIYLSWDPNIPFSDFGAKMSSIRFSRILNTID